MINPSAAKILIVSVIYNQKITGTNVYKTLLSEKEDVYIHDNSPNPQHTDGLPESWKYFSDPSNPGLSAAYNRAAGYAAANGYDWLLLTDQDTIFPENALATYRRDIREHTTQRLLIPSVKIPDGRYISPVKSRLYFPRPSTRKPVSGKIELKEYAVINSGILVATDSFISCGGYNENVFLDFSDFQFVERFASKYPEAWLTDMTCIQNFSNISDSTETKLTRFGLFCRSLSGYSSLKTFGKPMIAAVVLKRAVSLCLSAKSLRPLSIFFTNFKPYIKKL